MWKVIIPVDIGCDKIQTMWEDDVVRRIIKHRVDGLVCGYIWMHTCIIYKFFYTHACTVT